jgi:tetratricopeptide (TPR) repeat protein
VGATDRADFSNGGFLVYDIPAEPVASPPPVVPYLPGAEVYCHTAVPPRNRGRMAEALHEHEVLCALCPEVLSFRAEWGHTLEMADEWPAAYRELAAAVHGGFTEPVHLVNFGLAAIQQGKYAEADAVLQGCMTSAPSHTSIVRISLGWTRYWIAWQAAQKGQWAPAAKRVDEAEALLRESAGPPGDRVETERLRRYAYVRGLQADLARLRGEFPRAAAYYREAAALLPGTREAAIWSDTAFRFTKR